MSNSTQATLTAPATNPSDPFETVRSDADERVTFCEFALSIDYSSIELRELARLSPLARAALANGVSFEDVFAYCEARARRGAL